MTTSAGVMQILGPCGCPPRAMHFRWHSRQALVLETALVNFLMTADAFCGGDLGSGSPGGLGSEASSAAVVTCTMQAGHGSSKSAQRSSQAPEAEGWAMHAVGVVGGSHIHEQERYPVLQNGATSTATKSGSSHQMVRHAVTLVHIPFGQPWTKTCASFTCAGSATAPRTTCAALSPADWLGSCTAVTISVTACR